MTHERVPAKEIFDFLKTKNIFVRWFNQDRIRNYLRVTIGTDEQMETLVRVLADYLSERA